jgi:hypothetical protein
MPIVLFICLKKYPDGYLIHPYAFQTPKNGQTGAKQVIMTSGEPSSNQAEDLYSFDRNRFDAFSTERAQAALRTILASHFHTNRRNWNIVTLCRQQIAVGPGDTRMCDLCILPADAPVEQVVRTTPMICLNVISEESLALIQNHVDTFEKIGVKHVWLLDPMFRTGWKATSTGLFQIRNDECIIPGTSIGFRLSTVFSEMDEMIHPTKRLSVSAAIERSRSSINRAIQTMA